MFLSEGLCLCFGISSMLPKHSSKRHQEGASMCFGQSPLGEKRLVGAHLAADAGRLRTSSRTLQTASLPNRVGREHSRPPQFRVHQLAATGHIGTAGVPRGSYLTPGRVPDLSDSRLGAVGPVTRETPSRLPQTPRWRRQPCVFAAWGFRGLPRGRRRGRKGGVCRNERGRSCLLETNFTNEFCNN